MKILKVYTDFTEDIELLSDVEIGRLFKAMLEYASTGIAPELKGNERFVWGSVKKNIDSQRNNYEEMCKTNKRIATERHGASRSVKKKNGALEEQEQEQEQEYIPPISPKTDFDAFWEAYPNKKGKEAAKKAFAKVKVPLQKLLSAIEQQKNSRQWKENNGQYIPYPATWLNQGRWDDEVETGRNNADAQIGSKKFDARFY